MFENIKEILINELSIQPETITPETELITGLGMNSLELADLIVTCEDRFGVVFADEDLSALITLGDVASYLESHQ